VADGVTVTVDYHGRADRSLRDAVLREFSVFACSEVHAGCRG
jgi:hypothetical protein